MSTVLTLDNNSQLLSFETKQKLIGGKMNIIAVLLMIAADLLVVKLELQLLSSSPNNDLQNSYEAYQTDIETEAGTPMILLWLKAKPGIYLRFVYICLEMQASASRKSFFTGYHFKSLPIYS